MYPKTELLKRLKSFIKQNRLINSQSIGVAVSGGPDSVFMLYMLNQLKKDLNIRITVLHFNHKIRRESDKDALFVRNLSEKMNVEYVTDSCNVLAFAKKNKLSLEDAARIKRYAFFQRCRFSLDISEISLAHTKDDLAETFLMNMIRGSSLGGLTSMKPKRDFYIRPVLFLSKSEIMSFLQTEHVEFRVDESNKNTLFTRNKIRLHLMNILKDYNPNIIDTIYREADILRQENRYMENIALKESVKYVKFMKHRVIIDISHLKDLAIRRRVVSIACKHLVGTHYSLSFDNINRIAMLDDDKKIVALRKLVKAYISNSQLVIELL